MNNLYILGRRIAYITLGFLNQFIGKKPPIITILCYHSISDGNWSFSVNKSDFKKQINYLSENFDFISLKDVSLFLKGKKVIAKPSIVLTFDDGYKDVLQIIDFLNNKSIKPTMFILSNPLKASRYELDNDLDFLSTRDIKRLYKKGWEIGNHTATHKNMDKLNPDQIKNEINESKKDLEGKLMFPISYISYPKGKYNEKILEAVKKSKYTLGLSMDDGEVKIDSNPLTLPRIGINGTHSLNEFKYIYFPWVTLLRKALK